MMETVAPGINEGCVYVDQCCAGPEDCPAIESECFVMDCAEGCVAGSREPPADETNCCARMILLPKVLHR